MESSRGKCARGSVGTDQRLQQPFVALVPSLSLPGSNDGIKADAGDSGRYRTIKRIWVRSEGCYQPLGCPDELIVAAIPPFDRVHFQHQDVNLEPRAASGTSQKGT